MCDNNAMGTAETWLGAGTALVGGGLGKGIGASYGRAAAAGPSSGAATTLMKQRMPLDALQVGLGEVGHLDFHPLAMVTNTSLNGLGQIPGAVRTAQGW